MKNCKNLMNSVTVALFAIVLLTLGGCERSEVPELSFIVTTEKNTYVAGEEVTFIFTGESRLISFTSGESDKDNFVPLKGYLDTDLGSYTYIYAEPGTYKATFIASNTTIYDTKVSTYQIEVTILPKSD